MKDNVELSRRVQPLIEKWRETLDYDEFSDLMQQLNGADSFEALPEESQQRILTAEASKS